MDTNEAIKKLQQLKARQKQSESENSTNIFAKALNTFKNIIIGAMSDLTDLMLRNEPKVTVKNFPKTTTITNKEFDVNIKNFPKKEEVEKVEVINQPKFEFPTHEITAKIDELIKGGIQLPPELLSLKKLLEQLGKNNFSCLEDILKAVEKLKLNPTIKVDAPTVNVPAPIVNIPAPKFPEYPKKMEISNFDLSELVIQLEEIITELKYNAKQPVVVANIGDMPVATFNSKGIIDAIEANSLLLSQLLLKP